MDDAEQQRHQQQQQQQKLHLQQQQHQEQQQQALPATEYVTHAMTEFLQLSGERDRLKSVLVEDLRTEGWTAAMFKAANLADVAHQTEHDNVSNRAESRLTARQLADIISKHGRGMCDARFCV